MNLRRFVMARRRGVVAVVAAGLVVTDDEALAAIPDGADKTDGIAAGADAAAAMLAARPSPQPDAPNRDSCEILHSCTRICRSGTGRTACRRCREARLCGQSMRWA